MSALLFKTMRVPMSELLLCRAFLPYRTKRFTISLLITRSHSYTDGGGGATQGTWPTHRTVVFVMHIFRTQI